MHEPRKNAHSSAAHDTRHRVSENAHSSATRYVYTDENAWLYATAAPIHTLRMQQSEPWRTGWGKLAAWDVLRVPYGASRTLRRFRFSSSAGFIAFVTAFGCSPSFATRIPLLYMQLSRGCIHGPSLARKRNRSRANFQSVKYKMLAYKQASGSVSTMSRMIHMFCFWLLLATRWT